MIKKDLILLLGNYNAGNLGDNSLMKSALKGLVANFANFKFKIIAPKKPADSLILPTGFRSLLTFGWIKTPYYFLRAKYAVFGGGGLLNVEEYRSLIIWGSQIFFLKLCKTEIFLIANSITPSNSRLLRYLLSKVDLISVRDNESFLFLNKLELGIPVRKTADLAFCLDANEYIDNSLEYDFEEFVVINMRSYKEVSYSLQLEVLNKIISHVISNTTFGVYLLPFDKSDLSFLRRLSKEHSENGRVLVLPLESDVVMTAIAKAKLVVSQRLHPLIFSLILNKPTIALSYSTKVISLVQEILEDEYIFDLRATEFDFARIESTVSSCISESNTSCINLTALERIKKEAEMNFSLLKTYIKSD